MKTTIDWSETRNCLKCTSRHPMILLAVGNSNVEPAIAMLQKIGDSEYTKTFGKGAFQEILKAEMSIVALFTCPNCNAQTSEKINMNLIYN